MSVSVFSSERLTVPAFMCRPSTHFELVFVYDVRSGSRFILLHVDVLFSCAPFIEITVFPPLSCPGAPDERAVAIDVWVSFWILGSAAPNFSLLVPAPHSLDYLSFGVNFEVGKCLPLCSPVEDWFGHPGALPFPSAFQVQPVYFCKDVSQCCDRDCVNSEAKFCLIS